MGWALITGASGGLGRALAERAAQDGYDLILTDRAAEAVAPVAEALSGTVQVVTVAQDLSAPGGAQALWEAATAEGREVDVLVNNAGLGRYGSVGTQEGGGLAREHAVASVNVTALTELTQLALGPMQMRGRGRVLNVASIAAWTPGPGMASYHASKAYVLSFSRAVAGELRGSDVTVTALCPGPMATDFFTDSGATDVWLTRLSPPIDPARAARAGWRAMLAGRGHVVVGRMNAVLVMLAKLTPLAVLTPISGFIWSRTEKD